MDPVELTVKERVLLFLLDYPKEQLLDASEMESEYVLKSLPVEISQEGIAESVGIRWNHASRALKELTGIELVEMKKANIEGGRRTRRVYFLTSEGMALAKNVLTRVNNREFGVFSDGDLKRMSYAQIHRKYAEDLPFFEFFRRFERIYSNIVVEGDILDIVDFRRFIDGVARVHHHVSMPTIDMVGRENEVQLVKDILADGPRTIVIIGLPGMGKTTLISNVLREIVDHETFYYPIHEWDSPRSILMVLAAFLEELKKYRLRDYLGGKSSEQEISRDILDLWEVHEILAEDLGSERALLVFDDHQKASERVRKLISMIHTIATESEHVHLCVLSREVPGFYSKRDVIAEKKVFELRLEGIDYRSVRALLERRGVVEPSVHPLVYQLTGGHPLAVDLIASTGGFESAEDLRKYIKNEVLSRVDSGSRSLLRRISVHRKPVDIDLIVSTEEEIDLIERLLALSLATETGRKIALHDVIRSVVYENLPEKLKKQLHLEAANTLIEERDQDTEVIYHFFSAEENQKAFEYLFSKIHSIIALGNAEVLKNILENRYSGHDRNNEPMLDYIKLEIFVALADYEMIKKTLFSLSEMSEISREIQLRVLIINGRLSYYEGRWQDCTLLMDEVCNISREERWSQQLAEALHWKGKALTRKGNLDEARAALDEALAVSDELGDRILRGRILMALSFVSDTEIEYAVEAARIFEEEGDLYDLAEAKNFMGRLYYRRGDLEQALEQWSEGIEIGRSTGNFRLKAIMEYNTASVLSKRGDLRGCLDLLKESTRTFRRIHFIPGYVYSMVGYGDYYAERGDLERAERFLRRGEVIAREYGDEKALELVRGEISRLEGLRRA